MGNNRSKVPDLEKHYTFTCQNIILENEFLINEFWNFPMRT